jgi:hypothetical protein
MTIELSNAGAAADVTRRSIATRSAVDRLRTFVMAAGIIWSVLFAVIGVGYQLQLYGDGAIFSYSIAVLDAWTIHWHNISGRLFVYLFSIVPAETYVALTKDARGGVALYGFLFFVAQFLGLIATYAADRSKGRIIFSYACGSTALLGPLVFGFPTEMWMAHAVFWPALAVCHYARPGIAGTALISSLMLALVFTHAGALLFALVIMTTLWLRHDATFARAGYAFIAAEVIWTMVKVAIPPNDYVATVLSRAALHAFDLSIFTGDLMVLIFATLAGFGFVFLLTRRMNFPNAHIGAAAVVALVLAAYWLEFDHALHADNRYPLRTIVLLATPPLGALAAVYMLDAENRLKRTVPLLPHVMSALRSEAMVRAATGAFALVMLIHAVETTKFVSGWTNYKAAIRMLATGNASDPALGDPHFVSSERIDASLNRLSWFSTTHFLSVLVAPNFAPTRLVVDPKANYFWLSCRTATADTNGQRAIPAPMRELVRVYSCLHR